jgi:DNA-binding NarL/FixJ family response regulator
MGAFDRQGVPPMKRGLLVDDHNLFRGLLAAVFEHHTDLKENAHAASLAEARGVLEDLEGEPDLAVVDLDLPDGEALVLVRELRELGVPVLAIAGSRSSKRRDRAVRAGVDAVLTTASSGEELLGTARRLIGK